MSAEEEKITNILVEVNNKELIPIRDLPKDKYEFFLEQMNKLRIAYLTVKK